jgi:hypothetical protein
MTAEEYTAWVVEYQAITDQLRREIRKACDTRQDLELFRLVAMMKRAHGKYARRARKYCQEHGTLPG